MPWRHVCYKPQERWTTLRKTLSLWTCWANESPNGNRTGLSSQIPFLTSSLLLWAIPYLSRIDANASSDREKGETPKWLHNWSQQQLWTCGWVCERSRKWWEYTRPKKYIAHTGTEGRSLFSGSNELTYKNLHLIWLDLTFQKKQNAYS